MNPPLHPAKKEDLRCLGIEQVDESARKTRTLELMDECRKLARSLSVMLETCTRCGACAKACHSYLGTFVADRLADLKLERLPMRATIHDPCNYARGGGLWTRHASS